MPTGRSPAVSGPVARVHIGTGRPAAHRRILSFISDLARYDSRGGRPARSYESNFEHSSAPKVVLTSIRQGDKADSDPKEEGGPAHEDIEL
jgi:hypothetical protein